MPLAGSLVRYRGVFVTLVTCGVLAIYPDDITTAHTLILEPWMNLFLLTGACLAFRRGHVASPRRLLWAGVAIGFAGAVKYWAALPALVLLAVCLLTGGAWRDRARRAGRYVLGVAAGFVVPVLPFFVMTPAAFVRSTLLDQAERAGTYVPVSLRLAHISGLIDFLNGKGHFTLTAGVHSLFASGGAAATTATSAGWLPFFVAVLGVAVLAVGYLWDPGRPSPLEWFVLASHRGRGRGGAELLGVLLPLPGLRGAVAGHVGRLRGRRAAGRARRPGRRRGTRSSAPPGS